MIRQFAMALGGCLAVSAVGLAQQMAATEAPPQPAPTAQPVQYVTPFSVPQQPTTYRTPVRPTMQPAQQPQVQQQYVPVQPVQSYLVTPNGAVAHNPAVMQAPVTPVAQETVQQQMMSPTSSANAPIVAAPQQTYQAGHLQPQQYSVQQPHTQYVQAQRPVTPATTTTSATPRPAVQGQPGTPAQAATVAPNTNMNCCPPTGGGCDACQQSKCCQPCGPDGRVWVSAEYLLWWANGMNIPVLVTSSPTGTPRASAGVLGQPGTRILYGDQEVNDGVRSGVRLRFGGWFDCCQTCGIEGSYLYLGSQPDHFTADCTTSMILARPIFNVSPNSNNNTSGTPIPDAELVCFPGIVNGTIRVDSSTDFTGFDVNFRKNWSCDCCNRIDWLVGFRYLKLDDQISINESLTIDGTNQALPVGSTIVVNDYFQTRNEFYGPQFGLTGEHRRAGGIYLGWRFLLGLGTTHKEATIAGNTTITPAGGAPTTYPGGFLALPTNIGRYSKNDFSVVPELGLTAGYQFSPNVRVFAGYSFIYWSNVTRAGDTIDLVVNTSQLPPGTLVGPARPTFTWCDSDFWAQGVSVGVELRY